jgi:hypothetical protein
MRCVHGLSVMLLAWSLSACVVAGPPVTETREIGVFRRLRVEGGVDVDFTLGTRSFSISGPQNFVARIEVITEGDVLVVRQNQPTLMFGANQTPKVTLSNDVLDGLSAAAGTSVKAVASPASTWDAKVSSGADVLLSGISSSKSRFDVSEGASLTVAGNAETVTITAGWGSDVFAEALRVQDLTVDFSGGASGRVAAERVTGVAASGATITVVNDSAQISVTSSSGGEVTRGR